MTPSPYRTHRRPDRTSEMPLFIAAVAMLLVALFVFGVDTISGGLVRAYARQGGGVLWAAASSATSVVRDNAFLSTRRALHEENMHLLAAVAMRDEQAARFQALQNENEALRAMAHLASSTEGTTVPVLSSFNSSPYGTFRIGGGSIQGIREGSLVLTPGGFVLGSVTAVSPRTATVEAFFAPGTKMEMQVDDIPFLVEGRGGGNARGEVPRDARIALNTAVLIPAFESRPAGIVGEVESASSSPYTTLYVRLPVNLDALRYVYVLPVH